MRLGLVHFLKNKPCCLGFDVHRQMSPFSVATELSYATAGGWGWGGASQQVQNPQGRLSGGAGQNLPTRAKAAGGISCSLGKH